MPNGEPRSGKVMTTIERLQSREALVCKQDRVTEHGAGVEWFVCLEDGYLLNCGSSRDGYDRANLVAQKMNT